MSTETEKEHDKLGPLTTAPVAPGLPLGEDDHLRAAVVGAFRGALAAARDATARPDLDEAVHEARKALRRCRAVVRMVADALPRDDRRELSRALMAARRTLSAARDLAVVPGTLADLPLDDAHRATADAIVASARAAGPTPDDTRAQLADAVAQVAPLGDVMAAALATTLDDDLLVDGAAATYRRARRRLRKGGRSRSSFHDFRKRSKELTYQLDLLAAGVDGRTAALRRDLVDLGDELGLAVDVIMARRFLAGHGADVDPDALDALLDAVDEVLASRIKTARRRARDVFARTTRRYARKVGKAVRRDHAPAEAAPAPDPAADEDAADADDAPAPATAASDGGDARPRTPPIAQA